MKHVWVLTLVMLTGVTWFAFAGQEDRADATTRATFGARRRLEAPVKPVLLFHRSFMPAFRPGQIFRRASVACVPTGCGPSARPTGARSALHRASIEWQALFLPCGRV